MSLRRLVSCTVPIACALLLAACGGGGGGGGGTTPTKNSVVAAASAQQVQAVIGGSSPITVSFTSSDGNPVSNVKVTTDLTTLPAGWAASTSNFTCSQAVSGTGCMLTLTFTPTSASSGTLTISYSYNDNAGEAKTGTFSVPYASTAHNNVVATAAPAAPYAVVLGTGASAAVSVYFTTDDGNPATNLQVTTNLAGLPGGWSSTAASLACTSVSIGNGCALPLKFAPTAVASGTLSINYTYNDNAGTARTGIVSLPYASSAHNHVVGTPSPNGPVSVVYPSGSQVVTIGFTTDDGNPATNFVVTSNLAALAPGWTSNVSSKSCASVAIGNGCQLQLTYAPTASAPSSVLPITFTYTDGSGTPGNLGTVNITYGTSTSNNAVASVSPVSPVTAVAGGAPLPVTVTFTTDDMKPATDLTITGPATLPTGWTAVASAVPPCATFSTGNGCQLKLSYAPSGVNSGTLPVAYSYKSGSGVTKTGSVNIAYSATTHNMVGTTNSPSGQVAAAVNGTAQPVTVTFNTNDANPATTLTVTTNLAALPSGWTAVPSTTFACPTVASTGIGCQLSLSFAPTIVSSGTLAIAYSYTDNAGTAQTGTASVPYAATSNNNVANVVAPIPPLAVATYSSTPVTVTFNTDDANPATGLNVTSGLATLPTGWTAASTFACPTVTNTGTGCQLSLTYAPTTATSGTVSLGYAYTSNTGVAKTGTVSIPYSSVLGHIYVADGDNSPITDTVWRCAISATTGAVTGCTSAFMETGLDPRAIVLKGNYAYVVAERGGTPAVFVCQVNADGSLGTCAANGAVGTLVNDPFGLAVNGNYLYVVNRGGGAADPVTVCEIIANGADLSNCQATATAFTASGGPFVAPWAIAFAGNVAYVADASYDGSTSMTPTTFGSVVSCTVNPTGTLTGCAIAAAGADVAGGGTLFNDNPTALTVSGSSLFVGTSHVQNGVCTIGTNGVLSDCIATGPAESAYGIAVANGFAYVAAHNAAPTGQLLVCTQPTATTISPTCTPASGLPFSNPVGMTPH